MRPSRTSRRMQLVLALAMFLLAAAAHAQPLRNRPAPSDQPLPATLANINANRADIAAVGVMVNLGLGKENPTWAMTRPAKEVFLANLLSDPTPTTRSQTEDRITLQAKNPEPAYKGLTLRLMLIDGRPFKDIRIHNGRVTGSGGLLKKDDGRRLEYFTWGTARIKRESVLAARVMPVLTFEQCRLMAQQVVETTPRQCLLPDGDIILESDKPLTAQALKSTDFDTCLHHGIGLINTFPRRCVSPGGRVYAEPPRLLETPADAPLASDITDPLDPNLTANTPTIILSGSTVLEATPAPEAAPISATTVSATQPELPVPTQPSPTVQPSPTAFPAPQPLTTGLDAPTTPLQPSATISPTLAYPRTDENRALTSPPITVPGSPTVPAL